MKPGITVVATGIATAPPDRCVLTVGASRVGATVSEAMTTVNGRVHGLMEVLAGLGITRESTQTVDFSIWPEHDREGSPTGFRVRNTIRVEIDDLETVGTVVAAATGSLGDATEFQGISFQLLDTSTVEAQARKLAWRSARAKAEQLAIEAGVRLGAAVSISESERLSGGARPMRAMAMAEAAPIEAGANSVRVDLMVRFALAG